MPPSPRSEARRALALNTWPLVLLVACAAADAPAPSHGPGITSVTYHGGPMSLPPLHLAAYTDNHHRIAELFDTGAEPHEASDSREPEEGRTPLLIAAKRCKTDSVRMLLSRGASPTLADNNGRTPLIEAAANCHVVVIEPLLAAGAGALAPGGIDAADARGHTALMAAAHLGNADSVRKLLSRGANPTLRSENGKDALAWAQAAGKADTVALLSPLAVHGRNDGHDHNATADADAAAAGGGEADAARERKSGDGSQQQKPKHDPGGRSEQQQQQQQKPEPAGEGEGGHGHGDSDGEL
jgi:hypothetical protein